ncbi:glycosyltransferase family 39 protein [Compostimonas suwonensis]|uniref:glycosyltransferase family 39 protein n=1 Tax=Compostimonas suwonensis TaxID=1048394 RepID=UPI0012FE676C|nr:glycosyltransferase family 39 protein [Compostimonas suwonensis]
MSATIGSVAALVTAIGSWLPSFWNDEAATLRLARLSWGQLLAFVESKDGVHCVYAAFMHVWIQIFGESELSVRAPSIIAIGAAAAGLYRLGLHVASSAVGLAAAAIFTVLPRTAFNGIEARSYAIATALVIWSAVCLLSAIRSRRRWWFAYVILMTLSIYVFLYSVLVLPAFLVIALWGAPQGRTRRLRVALGVLFPGVLAVPIAAIAVYQSEQLAWLQNQLLNPYTIGVETFFGSAWWMTLIVLGIIVICIVLTRLAIDRTVVFLLVWLLAPLLVLVTASLIFQPVFTPRYVSTSAPALALLTAMAVVSFPRRFAVGALAVILAAGAPYFVAVRADTAKPGGQNLRAVANAVGSEAMPGDAFLLGDLGIVSLRPRVALAAYPTAFADLVDLALRTPYFSTGSYSDELVTRDELKERIRTARRIWVVSNDDASAEVDLMRAARFDRLKKTEIGDMTVTLWRR